MIYVACPARYVTGGVELLHQLAAELRQYSPTKIWYAGYLNGSPQPAVYDSYGNEYVTQKVMPGSGDIVILPEIWASMAKMFLHPVVYWESVDNFVIRYGKTTSLPENTLHLTQSEYARQYVGKNISTNIVEVTDYLNDDFFAPYDETQRNDTILFNPAKGMDYTNQIMAAMPDAEFLALEGYSRSRIIELMHKSKLYIDFGDHPGKDRMPREAAMCGCCVITSRNGSAKFFEDVGIPNYYKFDRTKDNISAIAGRIREVLRLYPVDDFADYRDTISGEKKRFKQGVFELAERLGVI